MSYLNSNYSPTITGTTAAKPVALAWQHETVAGAGNLFGTNFDGNATLSVLVYTSPTGFKLRVNSGGTISTVSLPATINQDRAYWTTLVGTTVFLFIGGWNTIAEVYRFNLAGVQLSHDTFGANKANCWPQAACALASGGFGAFYMENGIGHLLYRSPAGVWTNTVFTLAGLGGLPCSVMRQHPGNGRVLLLSHWDSSHDVAQGWFNETAAGFVQDLTLPRVDEALDWERPFLTMIASPQRQSLFLATPDLNGSWYAVWPDGTRQKGSPVRVREILSDGTGTFWYSQGFMERINTCGLALDAAGDVLVAYVDFQADGKIGPVWVEGKATRESLPIGASWSADAGGLPGHPEVVTGSPAGLELYTR